MDIFRESLALLNWLKISS